MLNDIIPPEIHNDVLSDLLRAIASKREVKTILEIGSSDGSGSTAAIVSGLLERNMPDNLATLHCIELSVPRYHALMARYKATLAQPGAPYIACHNASTVHLREFPTPAYVEAFYNVYDTKLKRYPLPQVLGWLEQDIRYVVDNGIEQGCIDEIKNRYQINTFDMVLIDGSEFLGEAELPHVIGAKYIILDDVDAFKNYRNRLALIADSRYKMIADNLHLRNGYSAFELTVP